MKSFLILMTLVFIGCHPKSRPPFNTNEKLFRSKCSSCHSLPHPNEYTDPQWELIVRKYAKRAKLNENQTIQILKYLQNNNNK